MIKQCIIPSEEVARIKGLGFLRDKTTEDCFNCRVITRNGKITAQEMEVIAEASKLYGNGEVAMTTRMTVEIQKVPFNNIEGLIKFLEKYGLETGGTGPKVRPVVSCKGTTCQYGLIDTFDLSLEIHNRFYKGYHHVALPHKFKIGVGGCPNNCVKPDLNDIGVIGQKVPVIDLEKCKGCKNCQVVNGCPMKVCEVKDGKIIVDLDKCNHCGRCVGKCPFKVFEEYTTGYRIYIGGRYGKKVNRGISLNKIYLSKEEVLDTIEKIILFYKDNGIKGERFADTIERIGFVNVEKSIIG